MRVASVVESKYADVAHAERLHHFEIGLRLSRNDVALYRIRSHIEIRRYSTFKFSTHINSPGLRRRTLACREGCRNRRIRHWSW
jgi:hypothetical protein